MSSMGASVCELKVLSRGPTAVALCHWTQSETDNTTENEISGVHNMDHRTAF